MNRILAPLILLALAWCLAGCGTYVHEDGRRVLSTFADAEGFEFRTPKGTVLRARTLIHSKHTGETLNGATRLGLGLGLGATGAVIP